MDPDRPDAQVPGEQLGPEDLGAVSIAFESSLDLPRTAAALRVLLARSDAYERRLRVVLDRDMITLIGASSVEAADDRLVVARTIADNDNTRAIIRREPSDPFDRPVIGHVRIAALERNFRSERWQSAYVVSQWESRVVAVDVVSEDLPLWSATDAELVAAMRVASARVLVERWAIPRQR